MHDSILTVSNALPGLSPGLPHLTYQDAYTPFKPSKSEQRLPPLYYRGCWHRVSRGLFLRYRHPKASFRTKGVYNPKAFFPHAASLRQAFAHCAKFPTAASRRSLDRVSVPVWPIDLSVRLPVLALVSRYLANKLIGRRPLFRCHDCSQLLPLGINLVVIFGIEPDFSGVSQS